MVFEEIPICMTTHQKRIRLYFSPENGKKSHTPLLSLEIFSYDVTMQEIETRTLSPHRERFEARKPGRSKLACNELAASAK